MSALFNFQSFLVVILLLICTCTYVHERAAALLDRNKHGVVGLLWKAARVGERLSQYVSIAMIAMSFFVLFAPH